MKKVLLNILTHGDELIGIRVADQIRRLYPTIVNNGLDIIIANSEAYRAHKRYIDTDLNRVFPGNPTGTSEEKRAHELSSIIASYDLVIDIHSTESGSQDMVIVTKLNSSTKKILDALAPKYVLYMNMHPDTSLISCAQIGIALEIGSDTDTATYEKTLQAVEYILGHTQLIEPKISFGFETLYFEVFTPILKPSGAVLESHVSNFKLISAQEIFARTSIGEGIAAEFDFYPVIFGTTNYETIFGFAARVFDIKNII